MRFLNRVHGMNILMLGGTGFLSRVAAMDATARGHRVTALTRGLSGLPPQNVISVTVDRNDAEAMRLALQGMEIDAVIDMSGESVTGARIAAQQLAAVTSYAYVSSMNAYRRWPPGPIAGEDEALWEEESEDFGPTKAASERILAAAFGDRLLVARAGLIVGPGDPSGRLPWWLHRTAAGGRMVAPEPLDQFIAFVDVRDLAGWLVDAAERGLSGPVNATGPYGMTTFGGLLTACQEAVASAGTQPAEIVPVDEQALLAAGVLPWRHLPFWLPAEVASTAWQIDTSTARLLGLPSRPVGETVADTWTWLRDAGAAALPTGERAYGLPAELEQLLLSAG